MSWPLAWSRREGLRHAETGQQIVGQDDIPLAHLESGLQLRGRLDTLHGQIETAAPQLPLKEQQIVFRSLQ